MDRVKPRQMNPRGHAARRPGLSRPTIPNRDGSFVQRDGFLAAPRRPASDTGPRSAGWVRLLLSLVFLAASLLVARTLPAARLADIERLLRAEAPATLGDPQ